MFDGENEEQKPVEEVIEEAVEKVAESEEQKVADDRPERNYQAELARKNREVEQMRAKMAAMEANTMQRKDPNDLSTYSDNELRAIKSSNDPSVLPYKEQAEDILVERKLQRMREKERQEEKRVNAEMKLRSSYPQALDPSSEFALEMEQVIYDLDLSKSPAGRLAAAEIVARRKGTLAADAKGRKAEADRIASVKGQLVDGDRPKPPTNEALQKSKDLKERAAKGDMDAFSEMLKSKGISADKFFPQR